MACATVMGRTSKISCFAVMSSAGAINQSASTCSIASPIAPTLASAMAGALIIKPTGSSPARWQGSDTEQPSSKLISEGLRRSSRLTLKKVSSEASKASVRGATIGTVGISTAS